MNRSYLPSPSDYMTEGITIRDSYTRDLCYCNMLNTTVAYQSANEGDQKSRDMVECAYFLMFMVLGEVWS